MVKIMSQETRGTNILAVQSKIINPKMIFEGITDYNYDDVQPDKCYPMKKFTLLTDYIEEKLSVTLLKNIGTGIIPEMKKAGIFPNWTAEEFLKAMPHVYLDANRGAGIGQWKVISEEKNHTVLENTTMHNCTLEERVLMGGLKAFGAKYMKINQTECMKKRDNRCLFDITFK